MLGGFRYVGVVIYALIEGAQPSPSLPAVEARCGAGRNADRPQPAWWETKIRPLVEVERQAFPPWIDLAFLGAWIENESDGRDVTSALGEVGYFQLHPAEIEDMVGADRVAAVVEEIRSSPRKNVRWGGELLKRYDSAIVRFAIPRGTRLYHGLLKVMHASRPRGIRWLEHVVAVLGRPPKSYAEFVHVTQGLSAGTISPKISASLPAAQPSCSAEHLLARRNAFLLPGEDPRYPAGRLGGVSRAFQATQQAYSASAAALIATFGGASWPDFSAPLPWRYAWVSSGWGDDRSYRGGTHEGLDFPAPVGTPVYAAADGTVASVATGENAGLFVTIQHTGGWASRYMHLSAANVQKGQHVEAGSRIGAVGKTGTSRSGPHLHFDLSLAAERLGEYVARFGQPVGGFGTRRSIGVAVPSEPLAPARGYASEVVTAAASRNVRLYAAPVFPWHKALVGVAAVAFVGLLGFDLYRRRRA